MIVGSVALKHWFPDFPRTPKDLDVIDSNHLAPFKQHLRVEYLKNPILLSWMINTYGAIPEYCFKNELYTLKVSHSFWSLPNNSWEKHVFDLTFLKEKGCTLIEPLFYELFEYWNTIHGKRLDSFEKTNKKLMRTKESLDAKKFFTNNVKDTRDHDYLHTVLLKHPYFNGQELPTYTKVLKDDSDVDVCMEKFKNLSEEDKFKVTFEELCVMASENRYPKEMHYKIKYVKMLKQFILGHCKVVQGLWIIQNYKKLVTTIPFNYEEFLNNN